MHNPIASSRLKHSTVYLHALLMKIMHTSDTVSRNYVFVSIATCTVYILLQSLIDHPSGKYEQKVIIMEQNEAYYYYACAANMNPT